MNWIKDFIPNIKRNISQTFGSEKDSKVPEGLWQSCDNCGSILYIPELKKNSFVCSKCSYHLKINTQQRIEITFDKDSYQSLNEEEKFKINENRKGSIMDIIVPTLGESIVEATVSKWLKNCLLYTSDAADE